MLYKRSILNDIKEYLNYFPAVLISGARQVGKSTLILNLGIDNYYTLDDINLFRAAKKDPKGFIANSPKPMIIDEIQRVPELLITIKEHIDKDRKNGEFILTGSANLKGFKEISDSLAGRVAIIELFGLSLKEKYANHSSNLIDELNKNLDNLAFKKRDNFNIYEDIINGGYPEINKIDSQKAKYLWFSSYIRTYVEADTKDISNIKNMDKFINMYRLLMLRSSNIFKKSEIQNEAGLDNKTFDSYFSVLEHIYQIQTLKPYFSNELKRVIKTPKIYALDSGILCHLFGISSKDELLNSNHKGAIIETFIFNELIKANTYANKKANLFYYRTSDAKEIDFILDFTDKTIAIEVKSSSTIDNNSFKHIKHLKSELKDKFDKGIVFYDGDSVLKFGDGLYAMPFWFLK